MLTDQDSHELRGMLTHYLKTTPAASAAKLKELEERGKSAVAVLDSLRKLENKTREVLEKELVAQLAAAPPQP